MSMAPALATPRSVLSDESSVCSTADVPDGHPCARSPASSDSVLACASLSTCTRTSPCSKAPTRAATKVKANNLPRAVSRACSDCTSTQASESPSSSFPPSLDGCSSDSELGDDSRADFDTMFMYPVLFLLQCRAALGRTVSPKGGLRVAACDRVDSRPGGEVHVPARAYKPRGGEATADAAFTRKVRAILNKLTVEKFDCLYGQLLACGIQTVAQLSSVVHEIFAKATVQHHFISMYADLCKRLQSEPCVTAAVQTESRDRSFQHLLLDRCQAAFEQLLVPWDRDGSEDEEDLVKQKQSALGTVKFLGQLVCSGMLRSVLLTQCSEDLLAARAACPLALELLVALLTVGAPSVDAPTWCQWAQLNGLFDRLAQLAADPAVAPRERFLLRDLLDLRRAGWVSRASPSRPSGPARLEAVRAAAAAAAEPPQAVAGGRPKAGGPGTGGAARCGAAPRATAPAAAAAAAVARVAPPVPDASPPPKVAASPPPPRVAAAPQAGAGPRAADGGPAPPSGQSPAERGAAGCGPASAHQGAPPAAPPRGAAAAAPHKAEAAAAPPAPKDAAGGQLAQPFCPVAFRRTLAAIMRELATGSSVPAAVQRIREQRVPLARQAAEFTDILTRAAEECRGPARRAAFAFAAGIAAADATSAFNRSACLEGIRVFFEEVYADLCDEVPRLPSIIKAEMLPTLRFVLPEAELRAVMAPDLWSA